MTIDQLYLLQEYIKAEIDYAITVSQYRQYDNCCKPDLYDVKSSWERLVNSFYGDNDD